MAARVAFEFGCFLTGGDSAEADELLRYAERLADTLELPGLIEQAAAWRERSGNVAAQPDARRGATPAVGYLTLRQDGEFWRCSCDGADFRVKDTKGVRMLSRLLGSPGKEFHVLDLSGSAARVPGDAGPLLDDRARREYQGRIAELRAEVEEAGDWNDPERAAAAQAELDTLAAELSRAFGLDGRKRPAGSAAERARVNVQRRLRDAIGRIGQLSPDAGRHLTWAVKTGMFCRYEP